jgi:glutathione S-transferase
MRQMSVGFKEKRIALFTDTMEAELAPYFSNSKVPVLVDDDLMVWDTLAIMEYVSEQYLQGRGWPESNRARAVARSVSAEMHSSFSALREALPMNCRKLFPNYAISTEVQADVERVCALWRHCITEYGSEGQWLFGEYSIADAMFAPVVLRFKGYDVKVGEVEQAYMQTVLQQSAMAEWIADGCAEQEVIAADEVEV